MARILYLFGMLLFSTTLTAKSIVVLGDSLSAGYGLEIQQSWVTLLQKKIDQQQLPYTVFNESISGDTTSGGLARIDGILEQYKPELVILELGGNDGLRGLSTKEMKNNLNKIIIRSKQAGAKTLLLGMRIPPNYGKRYVDMFYGVFPQLADELNIPFVPFILEDVALVKELMQKDRLHPNVMAQPIIADKIWQHLYPLLEI